MATKQDKNVFVFNMYKTVEEQENRIYNHAYGDNENKIDWLIVGYCIKWHKNVCRLCHMHKKWVNKALHVAI